MQNVPIASLGPCQFPSPLHQIGTVEVPFKTDEDRILYTNTVAGLSTDSEAITFEEAGPREHIFFDPPKTTVGIVTCGGLCPGLNDIIRGIVNQCHRQYGVTKVYGFRYGYEGLVQRYGHTPLILRPESVAQIHNFGGTILGSSRGQQPVGEMVDTLEDMCVDILFVIGGDGSLRGAAAIMAADLAAHGKTTGLQVQACGDMHMANFGIFASAERNLIFGNQPVKFHFDTLMFYCMLT